MGTKMKKLIVWYVIFIVIFLCGAHAFSCPLERESTTLWVGDSIVSWAPVEGIKYSHRGGDTANLIEEVEKTLWPRIRYSRIVIITGTADIHRGVPPDFVDANIERLSNFLEAIYEVSPIVVYPYEIAEITNDPENTTDGVHLTRAGYLELWDRTGIDPWRQNCFCVCN